MRIGLSYHGGDRDYDVYAEALHRRAQATGTEIETRWLAGADRGPDPAGLDDVDAVVLTGGPDVEPYRYGFVDRLGVCRTNPERDAAEWQILEHLRHRPLPLLAVCRGAQILNVFHGGTLIADLAEKNATHRRGPGEERRVHEVTIVPGTALHGLAQTAGGPVNTSHHQAVERLADGFRVSARSTDGVIEAFEPIAPASQPFLLAVQWHPEGMDAGLPLADRVLDAFLRAEH